MNLGAKVRKVSPKHCHRMDNNAHSFILWQQNKGFGRKNGHRMKKPATFFILWQENELEVKEMGLSPAQKQELWRGLLLLFEDNPPSLPTEDPSGPRKAGFRGQMTVQDPSGPRKGGFRGLEPPPQPAVSESGHGADGAFYKAVEMVAADTQRNRCQSRHRSGTESRRIAEAHPAIESCHILWIPQMPPVEIDRSLER